MTKNCSTCQHRQGRGEFAKCYSSGYYISAERLYNKKCDVSFSQWSPRDGIFRRLYVWVFGVTERSGGES